MRIERLDGGPERAEAMVGEMLREYLAWCGERLAAEHGVVFDDFDGTLAAHHRAFTEELPHLLGPRGRLLVASERGEVVGVGALRPVDDGVAEIKRMYVRERARGRGVGRAVLERLLADAATIGYRTVRLETATFMREAHTLYRSLGFRERPIFAGTEAGRSGLDPFMLHMERNIDVHGAPPDPGAVRRPLRETPAD